MSNLIRSINTKSIDSNIAHAECTVQTKNYNKLTSFEFPKCILQTDSSTIIVVECLIQFFSKRISEDIIIAGMLSHFKV